MTAPGVEHAAHEIFMRRAIELANRGWYTTPPNPRVGCVFAADGQIIGEGWHERTGEGHAERRALADVDGRGFSTAGATVYITLEPCSHDGRTPPCADALIAAGVARAVIGARDPNPAVDGRGINRLRAAGIDVVTGVLGDECDALNPGFNQRMRTGRPRVRVKLAMSLDGRTAAANGESQWITGGRAREDGHRLRAESGAVMIGRGTCAADDPALTVRLPGAWRQPARVVLDSRLVMRADARMLALDGQTRIYTLDDDPARRAVLEAEGATVCQINAGAGGVDLRAVLADLAALEINDVLVEAGAGLAGSLAAGDFVDDYVIYVAPLWLGDSRARPVASAGCAQTLADARGAHY